MKINRTLVVSIAINFAMGLMVLTVGAFTMAYICDTKIDKTGIKIHKPQAIIPLLLIMFIALVLPYIKKWHWRFFTLIVVVTLAFHIYAILIK